MDCKLFWAVALCAAGGMALYAAAAQDGASSIGNVYDQDTVETILIMGGDRPLEQVVDGGCSPLRLPPAEDVTLFMGIFLSATFLFCKYCLRWIQSNG